MGFIDRLINVFTHLDQHLLELAAEIGLWIYLVLFVIVFLEATVTPFLPGDSLLFAVGALSTSAFFNVHALWVLFIVATVLGTMVSYELGEWLGPAVFKERRKWLNLNRLERTREFYRQYGNRTIFFARFVPFIRTLAPVVAGAVAMSYAHFVFYNLFGSTIWVALFLYGGYFFGSLAIVKENFGIVVLIVFALSLLPMITEWLWKRYRTAF